MGFWDAFLGRDKPVGPRLDGLFGLPSAALTLEAAVGFTPSGDGAVCFSSVEGAAFARARAEVLALLGVDETSGPSPVEFKHDAYGYSWVVVHRSADDLAGLVGDLHAVNTTLEDNGFGAQLLCSLVAFHDQELRPLALVYLYKRGTFYPFAPLSGNKRDNPLELQIRALIGDDVAVESDLTRWFPVWDAPGF
ncbi:MAG: hypothetical protein HOV94_26850 [Saccharothrix sp.]|nr:hypothetical protein [Saccharothrix sp.]